MQENKSEIEVLNLEPSVRNQFGKGFVYANGKKYPVWMVPLGLFLCAAFLVPMCFEGSPTKEEILGIDPPNLDNTNSSPVNIPFYSAEKAQSEKEESRKKGQAKIVFKYAGLQSIDRDVTFELPPGTEAKAKIVGGVTDGPVRAELTENLMVDGHEAIRAGTLFIGLGSSNDDRLQIAFSAIVIRGKRIAVQAQAIDPDDKNPGVQGSKLKFYSKKLGVAVGFGFVSGMTDVMQDRESNGLNVVKQATLKNGILNGLSQTAADLSKSEMDKVKANSSSISLSSGTEIIIGF